MAAVVEYTGERPYELGPAFSRPLVPARISDPITRRAIDRLVLVDSGADISMIPLDGITSLGIDTSRLVRSRSWGTAGEVACFEVELLYEVCGVTTVAKALSPIEGGFSTYVLGREPFFRLVHFGFAQFADRTANRTMWRGA